MTRGAAPGVAPAAAAGPDPVKTAADQIALPLDWPQAQDDSRFILSDANRAAFEHFRAWSMWPVKATMLTGPRRSGRSLLARAFVARVGGRLFDVPSGMMRRSCSTPGTPPRTAAGRLS